MRVTLHRIAGCLVLVVTPWLSAAFVFYPSASSVRRNHRNYTWRTSLASTHVIQAPSMASTFAGDDDDDDTSIEYGNSNNNNNMFPLFSESSASVSSLTFLPQASRIPPQTKALFARLSEAYIYNTQPSTITSSRKVSLERVLQVIEAEHVPLDVPILLNDIRIDVKQTGDDMDESVAEIFSLAAMYGLPKEITLQLINGCIDSSEQVGDATQVAELEHCRDVFAKEGWAAVSFPKGLALRVRKKYDTQKKKHRRNPFAFLKSRQRRIEFARQAVLQASQTQPPEQQIQTREDFLKAIEKEITNKSSAKSPFGISKSSLQLFFPNSINSPRRRLKNMTRAVDRQLATFKRSGRATVVAYGFINFCLYTVGALWHWNRVALVENPFQASSVASVLLKKVGTVLGSVYLTSHFLRIPKVIMAMCLTPMAQRLVNGVKEQLDVSETVATALLIGLQCAFWLGIVSVPALSEYTRLRRLVNLERLMNGPHSVAPAIYTVTMGVLQEC